MKKTSKRVGVVLFLALIAGPAVIGSPGSSSIRPSSLNDGARGTQSMGGNGGANREATSPGTHRNPDRLAAR